MDMLKNGHTWLNEKPFSGKLDKMHNAICSMHFPEWSYLQKQLVRISVMDVSDSSLPTGCVLPPLRHDSPYQHDFMEPLHPQALKTFLARDKLLLVHTVCFFN